MSDELKKRNWVGRAARRAGISHILPSLRDPKIALVLAFVLHSAFYIPNSSAQSTNKTFMLNNGGGGTVNNKLPPNETNFFVVNSNLLNAAVAPNGGSGGTAQSPWAENENGSGYSLSNISAVDIVGAGSAQALHFVNDSMAIGDSAGTLAFFNPTSTDFNFGGSSFGSSDGVINAATVNAAFAGNGANLTSLNGSAVSSGSVSAAYLPVATTGAPGIMRVGSGLSVSAGVVSATGGGGVTPAYSSQFQTVSLGTGTATNVTDYPTNFASLFPYVAGVSPVAIQGVDSLTSGTGSGGGGSGGVSNYLMFASNYYGLHFAASTNLSAGGEQLGTWSSNYTSILHPYAPGKGTNQFLFLWGGINDLSLYNETAEATYLFFTNIAYKAHQDGMIVVAMTCTYVATNTLAQAWETYRYNNYLRNSPTNWDYLVDVAAIIPPPSLNSNLYVNNGSDGLAPDIVHITNAGQQFIAYEMSNVLSRAPHALTTKLQEPFVYGQVFTWATNNNNNTGNILYGNLAIKQSVGGLNYATRDLNTPYAQTGTWAGAGFDSGNSAYGFSCFFSQSVNFYGWLTAADAGTEFMSYCAMNGTNGVTFPNTSIYVRQSVVATNGFASYNTNVLTAAAASSWSGQYSTIDNGFTNTYGTNCTININGSVGYFVFWHSGGEGASAAAANPVFTNALSTNGWSRSLPINCGVQVFPLTGQANVTVDFGQ
jgi:hypothetical protein